MSCFHAHVRLPLALLPAIVAVFATVSCAHNGETSEEARVKLAFEACKRAMIDRHAGQAMSYIPRNVHDYLDALNSGAGISPHAAARAVPVDSPGVDLLLRTAI